MYITKADEILGWMSSKGNVPAGCRRSELNELREAARVINSAPSSSGFGVRTPSSNQHLGWLLNALDGNSSQYLSEISQPSFDSVTLASLPHWNPDEVLDDEWFWGTTEQATASESMYDRIS